MWIHPRSTPPTDATLGRAVRALRESTSSERLSASARSAILRRVSEPGEARTPLAVLFPSSWRLALAGGLPLALALSVVLLAGRGGDGRMPADRPEPVVQKVGGRVVFEVAGGATITKSSVPFAFDARSAVRVEDGRYADSMRDGHRLVFYKIE